MKPQSFKKQSKEPVSFKKIEPQSIKKKSQNMQGEEKAQLDAISELVQLMQDSNKSLTLKELKAVHPTLKEFLLKKKFEHFDDDNNKKLDANEMSQMFKFTPTEEIVEFTKTLRELITAFDEAVGGLVKLLDADGNNTLCVEELKTAYPDSGLADFLMKCYDSGNTDTTLDTKEMSKMFLNWNGEYQTEEVVNFTTKLNQKIKFDKAAKEFVQVLDDNEDRKLNDEELRKAYPQFGNQLVEFLVSFDSNGDGELNADEVKKIFQDGETILLNEIEKMIDDLKMKKNPNLWALCLVEEPDSE